MYGDNPQNPSLRPDYQHGGYQRDDHTWQQPSLGSLAHGGGYPAPRPASQPTHRAQAHHAQQPVRRAQKIAMTGAEAFWYVLQCIAFGAGYICKIPVKKALVDYGMVPELTGAERFWYVLMNVGFGSGYFAKVIISKAVSEMPQFAQARQAATIQAHTRRV